MTFATYTTGIPAASHNPSNDQGPMQVNTNSINNLLAIDHFSFNNNLGGYHQQVHLVNESNPGIGTANAVIYSNILNGNTVPWFTNSGVNLAFFAANANAAVNGVTSTLGGIIMQWGTVAATAGNPTVSFSPTFPNAVYNIQVTRQHAPASPGASFSYWVDNTTITTAGFKIINNDGHTWSYNWFAVGS